MSPFENPHILATQIGSWLPNYKTPGRKEQDYAAAPKVRTISKGESLFRTRCAACHTIGAQDSVKSERRRLGPDLEGVTGKRDRGWLTRFLAMPDKMVAEKDPLALALLAEYDNVLMPNFRLSGVDIQALLTYIEEESNRLKLQRHPSEHRH
jgi:protein SCO1/2